MTTRDIATLGIRVDAREVREGDRALEEFGQTGERTEQRTDRANAAMARMTKMAKAVAGVLATMAIYEHIKEVTLLASRYNQLGVIMGTVGRNAGISTGQLMTTQAALEKTGISALQSREAISKLITAHIDLNKATDLARVAQDAATFGNMSSSEAFGTLIKGIQSAEKETLETIGLNVNFQQSYEKLAKSLGKKADALTTVEKTQAAVNAVMEKAPDIAGAYDGSMTNAGKQLLSMSRHIENLKVQLGQPFQNPFGSLVTGATSALKLVAENVGAIRSVMEATIEAVAPAVKIVSAYFALFVAAPAIYAAAVAALTPLVHMLAVYAMNVLIGQANTIGFNTVLFGTSVAANLANGSLTKLALGANLLFAAFAGWQIGEYLNDQFVEVRVAGEIMAGGLLEAWERMKFGGKVAFDALFLGARVTIQGMERLFATWFETLAKGFRLIGKDNVADEVEAFAGRIRKSADAQGTFASRTAEARAEMEKNLKVIDQDTDRRVQAALVADKVSEATKGAAVVAKTAAAEKKEQTKEQKAAYDAALKTGEEYVKSLQAERLAIGATESQQRMLNAARAAMEVKDGQGEKQIAAAAALRQAIMAEALALDLAAQAWEKKKAAEDAGIAFAGDTAEIWKQVEAINAQIDAFGKSSKAAIQAEIAKHEGILAARLLAEDLSDKDRTDMEDRVRALRALAESQAKLSDLKVKTEGPQKLLDVMEALSDASKDAAANMESAFGRMGGALGGIITSMATFERSQAAIAKQLKSSLDEAAEKDDPKAAAKAKAEAFRATAQAQMKSYGDMAKAGKAFFKENSAGYRAMEGAEKAFRAFEIALAFKTMLEKSGILQAFTAMFVTSKATETAATVASVAPDVAASMTKGQAAAAAGVAGQAQGDPYTAWGRMAAMAAVMAALGFAVSGGSGAGGGVSAADAQAKQGTGSVFGDSSAKSNSIARSIELSAANSNIELVHTAGMLSALLAIRDSMDGLNNLISRSTGVTDGSNFGVQTGQIDIGKPTDIISKTMTGLTQALFGPGLGGKIAGFINNLWGKTTQDIIDSGLQFGGSVNDLQAGKGYAQYASVNTTKSSWFGLSKKTTNSVQTQGLDDEISSQLGLIFTGLETALKIGAANIGVGADYVERTLDQLTITTTQMSLKGLTGDELTAAINGVISKTMDQMAEAVFPAMDQFRRVGEGYAETVVRITTNYANLDSILDSVGMKFGAVGLESLAAREGLIAAAGGIDTLAGKMTSFADNFMSEAERLAPLQKYVADQLAAMGLAALDTRDKFKAYLLALDPANAAEQAQIVALLDLQDAFAKTHAATVDLTKSQQAIADERADLQERLDDLTLSAAQKQAKLRAALDVSNRALFDQVTAIEAQTEANNTLRESMQKQVDTFKSAATSLRDYGAGLQTGNLSTLTPEQQLAEAQAQYADLAGAFLSGQVTDASKVQTAMDKFLTLSQQLNGGNSQYSADYAGVQAMIEKLAAYSESRVDSALAQIAALERVTFALDHLTAALTGGGQVQASLTNPNGNAVVRDNGDMRTASELAMLRAQLKAEAEANAKLQTEAAILNRDVTMRAADTVATAVTSAPRTRATASSTAAALDG